MAVIVPIIMYVSGASAAIGAAVGISAAAVSSVASLALQVTGVNNKINKAASKVFGEDFVQIVNIAGAVYGAVSSLGSAAGSVADGAAGMADAASAASSTADAATAFVNGSDVADDLFHAAGGLASDGIQAISSTSDASSLFATNGLDVADNTFNLANKAAGGGLASDGLGAYKVAPGPALNVDAKAIGNPNSFAADELANRSPVTGTPAAPAPAQAVTDPVASSEVKPDASRVKASAQQPLKAGEVSTPKAPATKPGSFFDKLLSNDKAVGELIKGVGGGISSAASNKTQKEALEFAKRKYHSVSGIRVA